MKIATLDLHDARPCGPVAGQLQQPGPHRPPPTPTHTPDPCDRANIEAGVRDVNQFMREFDDASALASNVPREGLADHIASLQGLRRAAEDQPVPECLERLKALEVLHMNLVIETLMAFIGGSASQEGVTQGVAAAQIVHNQYLLEASALLGLTPVVVTVAPTPVISTTADTAQSTAQTQSAAQPPSAGPTHAHGAGHQSGPECHLPARRHERDSGCCRGAAGWRISCGAGNKPGFNLDQGHHPRERRPDRLGLSQ